MVPDDAGDVRSGWRVARLAEIPDAIPVTGDKAPPIEQRDPAAAARWRSFAADYPDNDRGWHSIRRYFRITSFGVNATEASTGNPLLVPHDETQYGQEELYLVLEGRARFVCDGEEVEIGEGGLVFCPPEVHRTAFALETPTVLLLIGGIPGSSYAPPSWSADWRPRPSD